MKITVIGAGFVGLTTALGLCSKGHMVSCVDIEETRTRQLNRGEPPFYEPGIEELLIRELKSKRFQATTNLTEAMQGSDVSIICVGTPSTDKGIDLSYVIQAAADIGAHLSRENFHLVTVKSTVVPGSVDTHVRRALENATGMKSGVGFGLAMNPEFLREGCAVQDFMKPDRIVIGADDDKSAAILRNMYAGFNCPIITTATRNAEMIKYASNAMLATLISYANEITTICETVPGLSEGVVMNGLFEDKRFWCEASPGGERLRPAMLSYLRGGIGFGGSCFPKDVKALLKYSQEAGHEAPLLQAVLDLNEERSSAIVKRFTNELGGTLKGKIIAIIGVAFKPDTDDIRESPSLRIMASLNKAHARIVMHDPVVQVEAVNKALGLSVQASATVDEALTGADGAIIATSWNDYKDLNWTDLAKKMANPVIFDGRQVIPAKQQGQGFTYMKTGNNLAVRYN